MKYLSLAMMGVIIILSWFMIKTPSDLSAEQHARLQEVLKQYLAAYLKETSPTASDIQDPQVITRVIESGKKMHAQFKFFYTIDSDSGTPSKVAREGLFILTSENGNDWTAKMEKISDTYVEFSEALQISLSPNSSSEPATPTEEPKAATPQKTPESTQHKGH